MSSYSEFFEKAQKKKGVLKGNVLAPARTQKNKVIKKKKINLTVVTLISMGFFITLAGTFYFDEIFKLVSRLEVGIMANALAADEKGGGAEPAKETSADLTKDGDVKPGVVQKTENSKEKNGGEVDDAELDHFARLRDRKNELDKREESLNKMEAELAQQRLEMEQKLNDLENVRRKISSVLEEKVQVDDQKVENLVQFYSNMKPPQAAKIIETIDEDLAVQVVTKMKKKNAADIMNLLKPEKAQAISEKYVGYRK